MRIQNIRIFKQHISIMFWLRTHKEKEKIQKSLSKHIFFLCRLRLLQVFFRRFKSAIHSQLNWAILLCDDMPDGKTE